MKKSNLKIALSIRCWLIKEKAFEKFVFNVKQYSKNASDDIEITNADSIVSTFDWASSTEGIDFWYNLHLKFLREEGYK